MRRILFFTFLLTLIGCAQEQDGFIQKDIQKGQIGKGFQARTYTFSPKQFQIQEISKIPFPSAILSCEVKLGGSFYVTGFNSFCGPQEEGTIVSYVEKIKIEGGAQINGQMEEAQSCTLPFDIDSVLIKASQNNNNSVIPSKFLKDGKLKLENKDELTLPEGVYYFKEAKVGGKAVLRAEGEVLVFVQEDFKIEGQAKVNPEGNPLFRIISGKGVKIEGKSEIWGGIFGKEIKVGGTASANICVWSEEFKGEGKASLKCDRVLGLKEVKVYPEEVTIRVGENYQLSATAYDSRGKELGCVPISWLSENPQVAAIDQAGLVSGISTGDTNVTANILGSEGRSLIHVLNLLKCGYKFITVPEIPGVGSVAESDSKIIISMKAITDITAPLFVVGVSYTCFLEGDFDVQVSHNITKWDHGFSVRHANWFKCYGFPFMFY